MVIILVVFVVAFAVYRNGQDLKLARDEVRAINMRLEERVKTRTADLAMARERAEVLLVEVNHRVANSLQLVAVLVPDANARCHRSGGPKCLARNAIADKCHLADPQEPLYVGDVTNVALKDYLGAMLVTWKRR